MNLVEERERCLVGLIGADIASSLTPAMHELEGDALGLRYVYQTIDLRTLGLAPEVAIELVPQARRLGFAGLNVTHPCKRLIASHLDALSPEADVAGSVNTVVFDGQKAIGHNTDGTAFRASLKRGLPDASLADVVIVGAGGVGSAVCPAVLEMGARRVTVLDKLEQRAADLAAAMERRFGNGRCIAVPHDQLPAAITAADGVINATPVGMVGHPGLPFDPDLLDSHQWVADIVYRPLETHLLTSARERGCRVLDGGGMAVLQAVDAFRLFARREPDPARMFRHFSHLVALAGESQEGTWWDGGSQQSLKGHPGAGQPAVTSPGAERGGKRRRP